MARKQRVTKRVALNRDTVDAIVLGYADGLQAAGEAVQDRVHPPDAAPYGRGLVQGDGVATYVMGKKVAGNGTPPRAAIPKMVGTVFGWRFPARFQELGTSHQEARPFFTPVVAASVDAAAPLVAEKIRDRLRRVPD